MKFKEKLTRKELDELLKKRKIDKEEFYFVFQFLNNCYHNEHRYCIGCIEDALAIIGFFKQNTIKKER
jgi:hypothetical protein